MRLSPDAAGCYNRSGGWVESLSLEFELGRAIKRVSPSQRAAPRRFDWIAALILLAAGAAGFYLVVTRTTPLAGAPPSDAQLETLAKSFFDAPNLGNVLLLLLALLATTLGGVWFIVRLLHWRFRPTFTPMQVWRRSLWVALFVVAGAWLQLNRSLTLALAALVAGALALLEVFLSVRER